MIQKLKLTLLMMLVDSLILLACIEAINNDAGAFGLIFVDFIMITGACFIAYEGYLIWNEKHPINENLIKK
jgi:arginine exporter protein ArgO